MTIILFATIVITIGVAVLLANTRRAVNATIGKDFVRNTVLTEMFQHHIAAMDRRFGDIERRFSNIDQQLADIDDKLHIAPSFNIAGQKSKPEVEGLKKRPKPVIQDDQFETIGEHIRFLRTKLGLSQTALGGMVGTSGSTISFWESGKSQVGQQYMKKLCKALKVTEAVLVGDL